MEILTRELLPAIVQQLDNNLVIILTGARQVGKTFILKLLTQHLTAKQHGVKILSLNLEDTEQLDKITSFKDFKTFLKLQGVGENEKVFIFLDEFQKLPQATKFLKLIYDELPNIKVVATGSSSLDIYKALRAESMAGRKRVFNVWPLSFLEFLNFRYPALKPIWERIINQKLDPTTIIQDFIAPADEFIVWGGYPRVVLSNKQDDKQEGIKEIYNAYVQKDVASILKMEDAANYNKMVVLLSAQIGGLLNINELSNTLNCARSTIERYLFVLENTFIVKQLPPFHTNKRKEITKMHKIYFWDTGMRNYSQKNFTSADSRADSGQVIENAVFVELLKNLRVGQELYFWRTPQGTEVDFILMENQASAPIEVKHQSFKQPTIPSGMKAFIDTYNSKKGFVLTKDFFATTQYKDCQITFLPWIFAQSALSR